MIVVHKNTDITEYVSSMSWGGSRTEVRDSSTGLSGVVWIDADTHTWQNGVATMSLTVTLKQMMDTKEG